MRKISILFFILSVFIFSSCVKDAKIEMSDSMNVTIEGYVLDYKTNDAIVGATVSGSFGVLTTNNEGYYNIGGLPMGEYRLTIEATDYLTIVERAGVVIGDELFKGDRYVEVIETYMSKPDQSFSTKMVTQFGPTYVAFANMPYEVKLDSKYKDRLITGATDSEGNVTIDSMPSGFFELNIDYRDSVSRVTYTFNGSYYSVSEVSPINIVVKEADDAEVFYLNATNLLDDEGQVTETFSINSDITFSFNLNLDNDVETFSATLVKDNFITVLTRATISGSTLTVSVEGGGHLEEGTWYNIYYQVKASDSDMVNSYSVNFRTEGDDPVTSLSPITSIALTTDPIFAYTSWVEYDMKVDVNSQYVIVYGNYPYDGKDEFVELSSNGLWDMDSEGNVRIDFSLTSLPGINIPEDGLFSGGRKFELIFQTVSDSGIKSDLSSIYTIYQTQM